MCVYECASVCVFCLQFFRCLQIHCASPAKSEALFLSAAGKTRATAAASVCVKDVCVCLSVCVCDCINLSVN